MTIGRRPLTANISRRISQCRASGAAGNQWSSSHKTIRYILVGRTLNSILRTTPPPRGPHHICGLNACVCRSHWSFCYIWRLEATTSTEALVEILHVPWNFILITSAPVVTRQTLLRQWVTCQHLASVAFWISSIMAVLCASESVQRL